MVFQRSAGAVIFREGDERLFLVLEHGYGHWAFARGHIEEGESEKEAAVREIEEETGITDLQFVPGFKETTRWDYKSGGTQYQREAVFFLAETGTEDVELSYEHEDYDWLPFGDALERLTYEEPKGVLVKAREHLEEYDDRLDEYF